MYYRHPSKQNLIFNEKLETVFKKLRKENKKTLICGDFNHNLLNYDKDKHVNIFLNTMLENNYQPCITEPTRITNTNKPSLVDNIFINTLENPVSGNILEHVSFDHLPNFVALNCDEDSKQTNIKTRDTKKFKEEDFQKDLLMPGIIQQIVNAENTNAAFNIYQKIFTQTLNKHAPISLWYQTIDQFLYFPY